MTDPRIELAVDKARQCHRELQQLCDAVGRSRGRRSCIMLGMLRAAVAVLAELVYVFDKTQPRQPRPRRGPYVK